MLDAADEIVEIAADAAVLKKRRRLRVDHPGEEASASRNHSHSLSAGHIVGPPRRVARSRTEQAADGPARIALQLGFRYPGRLKIEHVE